MLVLRTHIEESWGSYRMRFYSVRFYGADLSGEWGRIEVRTDGGWSGMGECGCYKGWFEKSRCPEWYPLDDAGYPCQHRRRVVMFSK
jgi:hypothetical protein